MVEPEVTRDEIIGGRLVVSSPSEEAHAHQHSHLNYFDRPDIDDVVAEALAAKGNRAIRRREAVARSEGKAKGKAEAVLDVLETRGIAVSQAQRQEILGCDDLDRLDHWLCQAALASSADEALQE